MQIKQIPIDSLIPYDKNTKKHDDKQITNVAESIRQYGFVQPLVIDKNNVVVIGHCRLLGAKKLKMTEVPCVCVDDLTDEQVRALRIVDNKSNESPWDFDLLADELAEIDLSDFDFDFGIDTDTDDETQINISNNVEHQSLVDKFIVPPFSILDTRQGYWQERKRLWKDIGISSEIGRNKNLIGAPDKSDYMKTGCNGVAPQTSIFDPVLCELAYKWFCVKNGKIYDCFAGGCVRGIVACKLGYDYYGIDLRKEQIDANALIGKQMGLDPHWYCDDSLNAYKYVEDNSVDMVFSCPPYADLEVYSDDPRDISNMEYDDFCKVYYKIIDIACKKLKQDRFAVFVVGDVRDKKGFYRNLVDYTKKCFNANGLMTYNELILVEQCGTGAIRASKQFGSLRKVIKTHQNVLVFYKGDPKKIKANYPKIEIDDSIFDD